jgi:hypothetical protein
MEITGVIFIVLLVEQQSEYCRYKKINKREHVTYSTRGNNITCKATWWVTKAQAV